MSYHSYLYKINWSSLIISYHNENNMIAKIGLQTNEAERQKQKTISFAKLNTSKTSFVIFDLLIKDMKSIEFEMPNRYSRMHYMLSWWR